MKNDGGSWTKHNVRKSEVIARNNLSDGLAPKLWISVAEQIEFAVENGWLLNE
jgi:putative hydrolase of HD superfamily